MATILADTTTFTSCSWERVEDRARLSPPLAAHSYERILAATAGSGAHILHWLAISPYFFPANQYNETDYYHNFISHLNELIPSLIARRSITLSVFEDFFDPIGLVDKDIQTTLVYGTSLYLKKDYLSSIYILTLQLEDLLRILLQLSDGEIYEQTKNGREKRPLGRVMRELRQTLPTSIYRYTMWLLKDREGLRLRDTVAHGLFKVSDAQPLYAITLIHLLCILTVLIDQTPKSPRRT